MTDSSELVPRFTENHGIYSIKTSKITRYSVLSFVCRSAYKMSVFFSYICRVINIINVNCLGLTFLAHPVYCVLTMYCIATSST